MKIFLKIIFYLALFFLPAGVFAAEVRIEMNPAVRVGAEIIADVYLETEDKANAVEGKLIFPELLSFKEIRDNDSLINFWIVKPVESERGVISFSGITPGGFSRTGKLFSVVFEGKKTGEGVLKLSDLKVLKNDGIGSPVTVSLKDSKVIVNNDAPVFTANYTEDLSPEKFKPILSRNESMFGGNWFIVFSAKDTGSGIASYAVKEYRNKELSYFAGWEKAESPYVLKDQELKSFVLVKAIDKSGNERVEIMVPQFKAAWYENYVLIGSLFIILSLVVLIIFKIWGGK